MERYISDIVKGFVASSYHLKIYCYRHDNRFITSSSDVEVHCAKWINCMPRQVRNWMFALWVKWKTGHCSSPILSSARILNPTVQIVGGTHLGYLARVKRRKKLYDCVETYLERRSYQSAKIIVAHSRLLQKELYSHYAELVDSKVSVVFPSVDVSYFHCANEREQMHAREHFSVPKGKTILLITTVGDGRKGLGLLLATLQKMMRHPFFLLVAGKKCTHDMPDYARYVGHVSDMRLLYAASDLTLMLSEYEPFGLVAIESLAVGTPVLLSPFVGAKDCMESALMKVLPKLNEDALIHALLSFDKRRCLNNFASKRIKSDMSVKAHVDRLERLINE